MVYESSLTQMSQFSDSLAIRPSTTEGKAADENALAAKTPEQGGDTITISAEARALIAPEKSDDSKNTKEEFERNPEREQAMTFANENMAAQAKAGKGEAKSAEDQIIEQLKEQIERLKEEIEALEESNLPEKEKNSQIQAKQAQLMELNDQLIKAQQEQLKASGQAVGGGTRANGFGNSVSSF